MSSIPLLASFPPNRESLRILGKELSWSTESRNKAQDLFDQGLPPLIDTSVLPFLFGVSAKLIAAMGKFSERYYRTFEVPKKSGGQRKIEAPRRFLKLLQRWIYAHMLCKSTFPSYVTGFVSGRSIFDNAKYHLSGRNLLVIDIQDFFPSVKPDAILSVFKSVGFPLPVAHQLSSLCTLYGRLPQGAPTSPAIANLAFTAVDKQLYELTGNWRCHYTRYADDMTFSGSKSFTNRDIDIVARILMPYGFLVNRSKSRIIGSGGRQIVTGLVVNRVAQPPRYKRRMWRAMFHRAFMHPREFSGRVGELQGVASFVNQFSPSLASKYLQVVTRLSIFPSKK